MVDALDSKSGDRKVVGVRVPFRAQKKRLMNHQAFFLCSRCIYTFCLPKRFMPSLIIKEIPYPTAKAIPG